MKYLFCFDKNGAAMPEAEVSPDRCQKNKSFDNFFGKFFRGNGKTKCDLA